jgi:hypothetical protein
LQHLNCLPIHRLYSSETHKKQSSITKGSSPD